MAAINQISRDLAALVARCAAYTASPVDGTDSIVEIREELEARLHSLEAEVLPTVELTRRRYAIASRMRISIGSCVDRQGVMRITEVLQGDVLPFLVDAKREIARRESPAYEGERDEMTAARVGGWIIGLRFSQGGYGKLYYCEHELTKREACAKVIPFSKNQDDRSEQLKRFVREVQVPATVKHPALVQILHAEGTDDYQSFVIVMEYLQSAKRLDDWWRERPILERLQLLRQVMEPLQMCHERGMVHRDLKPSNLMVDQAGKLRILDFGLVSVVGFDSATKSQQKIGTPEYCSPEQIRDARTATAASDIWTLGVIILEAATGTHPFKRGSIDETYAAILQGQYVLPPDLSEALSSVVRTCLSLDPDERFQDAATLDANLAAALRRPLTTTEEATTPRRDLPLEPRIEQLRISAPVRQKSYDDVARSGRPYSSIARDFAIVERGYILDVCEYCGSVERLGPRCAGCWRTVAAD